MPTINDIIIAFSTIAGAVFMMILLVVVVLFGQNWVEELFNKTIEKKAVKKVFSTLDKRANEEGLVLIKIGDLEKWRKKELIFAKTEDIRKVIKKRKAETADNIIEEIKANGKECWERYDRSETLGYYITVSQLAELKKKYLGEDINAPTKESEGEG